MLQGMIGFLHSCTMFTRAKAQYSVFSLHVLVLAATSKRNQLPFGLSQHGTCTSRAHWLDGNNLPSCVVDGQINMKNHLHQKPKSKFVQQAATKKYVKFQIENMAQ